MRTRVLIIVLLPLLALFACKKDTTPPPKPPQTPLVILLGSEPSSYDPQIPFDDSDYVLSNVYEPLVRFDSSFRLSPGLAHRWTNPDDKTWRFYLEETARFSDGSPLTANDVKFSIERLQKLSGSDRQGFTAHITSVNVVDSHTVDIRTASPLIILNNLCFIPILSERNVQAGGQPPFLGSGPYMFKTQEKGKRIVLVANPHHDPAPSIHEVQFLISSDPDKVLDDIVQFHPDISLTIPFRKVDEFSKLKKDKKLSNLHIQSSKGISVYYLVFNLRDSTPDFPRNNPLKDVRLRKAMAYATNKDELIQTVLKGFGRPATQLIAPEIFGFDPDISAPGYQQETARKYLAESKYDGTKIPIYGSANGTNMLEKTLIRQWGEVGIQAELKLLGDEELSTGLEDGTLSLASAGYICSSGDAGELLTFGLHTRGADVRYGKGNYAAYSNPEVDRITRENLRIFNPRERLAMLQKSLQIVTDELPYLPLMILNDLYIVSERVQWQPPVSGEILVSEMSFK